MNSLQLQIDSLNLIELSLKKVLINKENHLCQLNFLTTELFQSKKTPHQIA